MKNLSRTTILASAVSLALPLLAAAQAGSVNVAVAKKYSDSIVLLINQVFVPVLFAVAFLVFLYGVYKYFILGAAEEKSREEGRQFVLWGLIGFAAILSVWGLVNVILNTFGLTAGGMPRSYPTL